MNKRMMVIATVLVVSLLVVSGVAMAKMHKFTFSNVMGSSRVTAMK